MQEVKSASVEKDQNDIEWENNTNPIFVDFPQDEICIDIRNVNLWYGQKQALYNVDMPVRRNKINYGKTQSRHYRHGDRESPGPQRGRYLAGR